MRIYTVGWPRSGNKHLGYLLARALGERSRFISPRSRGGCGEDTECPTVCQSHSMAWRGAADRLFIDGSWLAYRNLRDDERLVWIVRDPRDTAISAWMLGKESGRYPPDYPLWDYLIFHFTSRGNPNGPPCGWQEYTEGWLRVAIQVPSIVQVRHEALLADREGELRRILRALGLPEHDERIAKAIAQVVSGMRPAYDGSGERVKPGRPEWPNHFGPVEAQCLDGHCGEIMERLKYGGEPGWLALLERRTDDDYG